VSDAAGSSRSIFANMAYASVSAASAGLLLVLFVVAGRYLGEIEFGKFSFALMLGTIFETLMDFGFHQVIIREVARDRTRARDLLGHTLAIKLLWAGGGLMALVLTATVLRHEWDVRVACYVIGGSLVMRSYMLTIRGVLMGLERFGWDSFVVLADRLILVALGTAALVAGTGLRGLTIAFVVARGLALAVAAAVTRAQLGGIGMRFDRGVWRELHRSALPLGFFIVVLNLYSYVDSVMLGVMRGDAETGIYAAAYKTYEGLSYFPSIIAAVLTPRLSSLFVADPAGHRRLALLGIVGSAALAVAVATPAYFLAMPLITTIFGSQFAPAAAPFRVLSVGLPLVFAIWVLHATAISVNKERLLVKAAVSGLVVNLAVNFFAIPRAGGVGAALATVVGELVSMVVLIAGLI
jgi:O-antigen/teichoic acid export membrane protein